MGWSPPATSMMANRRIASPTSSDQYTPSPSGPRWCNVSFIRSSVARSVRSEPATPLIPHILHSTNGLDADLRHAGREHFDLLQAVGFEPAEHFVVVVPRLIARRIPVEGVQHAPAPVP